MARLGGKKRVEQKKTLKKSLCSAPTLCTRYLKVVLSFNASMETLVG